MIFCISSQPVVINLAWANALQRFSVMVVLEFLLLGILPLGTTLLINTPANHIYQSLEPYGISAEGRTFLNFSVKGCDDAHIAVFQKNLDFSEMVEFVIGAVSNSRYDIREYRKYRVRYRVMEPGVLLNCKVFKPFWVSWGLNTAGYRSWLLGVGRDVFYNVIGNFTDTQIDNATWTAIGISSYVQHALQWEFDIENDTTTLAESIPKTDTTTLTESFPENDTTTLTELATVPATVLTTSVQLNVAPNVTHSQLLHSGATTGFSPPPTCNSNANEICFCKTLTTPNEEELLELVKNITNSLKISKKETNSYKRSLISMKDDRQSAQTLGHVGVLVIVIVFGGMCAVDLPRFLKFVKKFTIRSVWNA